MLFNIIMFVGMYPVVFIMYFVLKLNVENRGGIYFSSQWNFPYSTVCTRLKIPPASCRRSLPPRQVPKAAPCFQNLTAPLLQNSCKPKDKDFAEEFYGQVNQRKEWYQYRMKQILLLLLVLPLITLKIPYVSGQKAGLQKPSASSHVPHSAKNCR
mgnify:CR=1 FL=1